MRHRARVPCPFCGTLRVDVRGAESFGRPVFYCACTGCGARGPRVPDVRVAVAGWNGAAVRTLPPKVLRERGRPKLRRVK